MAFASRYADLIWDRLYTVLIPDHLTQDPEYLRRFGTYATQNREVDQMVTTNCITVMIPIIKIVEYFDKGIEVQIPSREDMLQMHRDIELYLGEWEEQLRRNIWSSSPSASTTRRSRPSWSEISLLADSRFCRAPPRAYSPPWRQRSPPIRASPVASRAKQKAGLDEGNKVTRVQ